MKLMMENKLHFNAPDREWSTVAHYFCQFGQKTRLNNLVELLKNLPTVEERTYFLNFNVTNKKGETPVTICYHYKMFSLLRYLAELGPTFNIANIPEKLPDEVVITEEHLKQAYASTIKKPEKSKKCVIS